MIYKPHNGLLIKNVLKMVFLSKMSQFEHFYPINAQKALKHLKNHPPRMIIYKLSLSLYGFLGLNDENVLKIAHLSTFNHF